MYNYLVLQVNLSKRNEERESRIGVSVVGRLISLCVRKDSKTLQCLIIVTLFILLSYKIQQILLIEYFHSKPLLKFNCQKAVVCL